MILVGHLWILALVLKCTLCIITGTIIARAVFFAWLLGERRKQAIPSGKSVALVQLQGLSNLIAWLHFVRQSV